jgi:hypothetical protein
MSYYKNLRNISNLIIESLMATGQNLGTGVGVYASTSGSTLQFKSLIAGPGITITSSSSEITISAGGTEIATFEGGIVVTGAPASLQSGIQLAVRVSALSTVTILVTDYMVICTGTGAQTVNLPSVAAAPGNIFLIVNKNTSGASPPVVINVNGGDTIQGVGTSQNLNATGDRIELMSDGINTWYTK